MDRASLRSEVLFTPKTVRHWNPIDRRKKHLGEDAANPGVSGQRNAGANREWHGRVQQSVWWGPAVTRSAEGIEGVRRPGAQGRGAGTSAADAGEGGKFCDPARPKIMRKACDIMQQYAILGESHYFPPPCRCRGSGYPEAPFATEGVQNTCRWIWPSLCVYKRLLMIFRKKIMQNETAGIPNRKRGGETKF